MPSPTAPRNKLFCRRTIGALAWPYLAEPCPASPCRTLLCSLAVPLAPLPRLTLPGQAVPCRALPRPARQNQHIPSPWARSTVPLVDGLLIEPSPSHARPGLASPSPTVPGLTRPCRASCFGNARLKHPKPARRLASRPPVAQADITGQIKQHDQAVERDFGCHDLDHT